MRSFPICTTGKDYYLPSYNLLSEFYQVAVNDKRVLGEIVENLETVSHLITRYAILEQLYLQRNSPARDQLHEMIVHLYAEVLTFLAKAKKYFQSSAKGKKPFRREHSGG